MAEHQHLALQRHPELAVPSAVDRFRDRSNHHPRRQSGDRLVAAPVAALVRTSFSSSLQVCHALCGRSHVLRSLHDLPRKFAACPECCFSSPPLDAVLAGVLEPFRPSLRPPSFPSHRCNNISLFALPPFEQLNLRRSCLWTITRGVRERSMTRRSVLKDKQGSISRNTPTAGLCHRRPRLLFLHAHCQTDDYGKSIAGMDDGWALDEFFKLELPC